MRAAYIYQPRIEVSNTDLSTTFFRLNKQKTGPFRKRSPRACFTEKILWREDAVELGFDSSQPLAKNRGGDKAGRGDGHDDEQSQNHAPPITVLG